MKRGFTFVEVVLTLFILALIAGIATPRVAQMQRARSMQTFRSGVLTLALEAREDSLRVGSTFTLSYDESSSSLSITQTDVETGAENAVKSLSAPGGISVTRVNLQGHEASQSEWKIAFYPDGSSDSGGIEFQNGEDLFYLRISPDGTSEAARGSLPDPTDDRWPAGNLEQRA